MTSVPCGNLAVRNLFFVRLRRYLNRDCSRFRSVSPLVSFSPLIRASMTSNFAFYVCYPSELNPSLEIPLRHAFHILTLRWLACVQSEEDRQGISITFNSKSQTFFKRFQAKDRGVELCSLLELLDAMHIKAFVHASGVRCAFLKNASIF